MGDIILHAMIVIATAPLSLGTSYRTGLKRPAPEKRSQIDGPPILVPSALDLVGSSAETPNEIFGNSRPETYDDGYLPWYGMKRSEVDLCPLFSNREASVCKAAEDHEEHHAGAARLRCHGRLRADLHLETHPYQYDIGCRMRSVLIFLVRSFPTPPVLLYY